MRIQDSINLERFDGIISYIAPGRVDLFEGDGRRSTLAMDTPPMQQYNVEDAAAAADHYRTILGASEGAPTSVQGVRGQIGLQELTFIIRILSVGN